MKLGSYLTPYTKINSKWIIDLNVRPETVKLQEGNIWENYLDIGLGIAFMDMTSKAQVIKTKTDNLGFIKLKCFCKANKNKQPPTPKTINREKKQPIK